MEAKVDPVMAEIKAATPTQSPLIEQWMKRRKPYDLCTRSLLMLDRHGSDKSEQQSFPPWQMLPPVL